MVFFYFHVIILENVMRALLEKIFNYSTQNINLHVINM